MYEARQAETPFSLLIYDNFLKASAATTTAVFNDILKNEQIKYILFYGPETINNLKNRYYKKVYFSNSPFSIHSRLNEMILFLKYYGVNH